MRRVGFAGVSALFCIVFLLASCDINPMTETVIRDPVTVRFYNGEAAYFWNLYCNTSYDVLE